MDFFLIFPIFWTWPPWPQAILRGQVMREESLVDDRDSQLQRWVVEMGEVSRLRTRVLLETAVTFQYTSRCRVYACIYILYQYCIYIYIIYIYNIII